MIITSYNNLKKEASIISHRLESIDDIKVHLIEEKQILSKLLQKLNKVTEKIEKDLKQLSGIEYKLYYEIVVSGLNVTKAIDKVAFDEDKDVSTLWKGYYPKVKEYIKLLNS